MAAFFLSPLGRWIAVGLAVAALAAGARFIYVQIEQGGFDRAIREIAAENQEALNRVRTAKNTLHACLDRGKSWDQSNGVCIE